MNDNIKNRDEMNNAIQYFRDIMSSNHRNISPHRVGATFIGINTNISGKFKLHIYILLFPFVDGNREIANYSMLPQHIYLKDICFVVDETFYVWLYEEMRKQQGPVLMSLEDNVIKVIDGFGDPLVSIDKLCQEQPKEWMNLEFNEWCNKKTFDNIFTIQITNPQLYAVPFPLKPFLFKTSGKAGHFLNFSFSHS